MGMDAYIDKCRKPIIKEFNGKPYRDYEEREQMCYWRKFWGLLKVVGYGENEYGKDIQLSKDDAERILDYACHNRDYFNGFDSVPQICELLDQWDELEEDGYIICFNANW